MQEATAAVHLTDDQRVDWLRLIRSDNVGPRTFRALVNHYGGARRALTALPDLAPLIRKLAHHRACGSARA